MAQFMAWSDTSFEIGFGARNLNEVMHGIVEGAFAAETQIGAACLDQSFDLGQDQAFRPGRRTRCDILGQTFALVRIEDGEAFEERNRLRLVAMLACRRMRSWNFRFVLSVD
jgi:hypothetical protein